MHCIILWNIYSIVWLITSFVHYPFAQQKKREMVASAFGEDETGGRQTRLTVEDLKYLFMM